MAGKARSAFPTCEEKIPGLVTGGLDIRDYFAAAALPGVIAAQGDTSGNSLSYQNAVTQAYKFAEEMMKQRSSCK